MRETNEYDFARQFLGEFRQKGPEIVPKLCPICHGGDKGDQYTFALNAANHTYNCKRGSCQAKGHFSELCKTFGVEMDRDRGVYTPPVRRSYRKPQVVQAPITDPVAEYLKARGITPETARDFGVCADGKGNIMFPYYRSKSDAEKKDATFVKYREPRRINKGERKMWREKDTEPILYGMHLCDPSNRTLYLFEGEFDCMCGYQAVKGNCVSVPSGCEDFTWLETCREWLAPFKTIVIMGDNDDPGRKMLRELSNKLECDVMRPDFSRYLGCKDANEIMIRHGIEKLLTAMLDVSRVEVKGLLNLSEIEYIDPTQMPKSLSGVKALDKATGGMMEGDLSVWTGERGSGKSTLLTQILLEGVEQGFNVCAYSGELPATLFKYWVNLQAAGSSYVKKAVDSSTGRETSRVDPIIYGKIQDWLNGRFWLYDNNIVEQDESESIISLFTLAYKRYNCKVFLVDNLMTVSSSRMERDYYQAQADFAIRLRKLASNLGVHIHLVVHPRKTPAKDKGVDNCDDVGGSGMITNIACNVFSLRRNSDDLREKLGCDSVLRILKNRSYGAGGQIRLNFIPTARRFVELDGFETVYSWIGEGEDIPFA